MHHPGSSSIVSFPLNSCNDVVKMTDKVFSLDIHLQISYRPILDATLGVLGKYGLTFGVKYVGCVNYL
jgi:hypothetical protein